MATASPAMDFVVLYQLVRRIGQPFEEFPAFEMGLIDKDGKRLRKAKTSLEKKKHTYLDRFVLNLKRLLSKVPGGNSKVATVAGALLLVREDLDVEHTDEYLMEQLTELIESLESNQGKTFMDIMEDAPANATGAAVAGTGDDPVHWKKAKKLRLGKRGDRRSYGKNMDGYAFLRRAMKKEVRNVS